MACCAISAYVIVRLLQIHSRISTSCALYSNDSPVATTYAIRNADAFETSSLGDKSSVDDGSRSSSSLRLRISGMDCASCSADIQKQLQSIRGVYRASVSAVTGRGVVVFDPSLITSTFLIRGVNKMGYPAEEMPDSENWSQSFLKADQERSFKIRNWQWAFYGSIVVAGPVVAIANTPDFLLSDHWSAASRANTITLLSLISAIYFGRQLHVEAVEALFSGRRDMSVLSSLGIMLALLKSILLSDKYATDLLSSANPGVALLTSVVLGGRVIRAFVSRQSSASLAHLISDLPSNARIFARSSLTQAEQEISVPVHLLEVSDEIALHPCQIAPADGVVVHGTTLVTETHITGELTSVLKAPGDSIYCGSKNTGTDLVRIRATQVGADTWLEQTIRCATEADLKKATIQNSAEIASKKFVDFILLTATVMFFYWKCRMQFSWLETLNRCTSIFLCACPCALGLATPTCMMISIGMHTT